MQDSSYAAFVYRTVLPDRSAMKYESEELLEIRRTTPLSEIKVMDAAEQSAKQAYHALVRQYAQRGELVMLPARIRLLIQSLASGGEESREIFMCEALDEPYKDKVFFCLRTHLCPFQE